MFLKVFEVARFVFVKFLLGFVSICGFRGLKGVFSCDVGELYVLLEGDGASWWCCRCE